MKPETFARRPFLVEAVRVSSTEMVEAAKWCHGEILTETRGNRSVQYIYLEVPNAKSERQKKAYVGDYLLKAGKGFKVYTPKAFDDCFEEPSEDLLKSLTTPSQDALFDLARKHAPGQS